MEQNTLCETIESLFARFPLSLRLHAVRCSDYMRVLYEAARAAELELAIPGEEHTREERRLTLSLAARYYPVGLLLAGGVPQGMSEAEAEALRGAAAGEEALYDSLYAELAALEPGDTARIRDTVNEYLHWYRPALFPGEEAPTGRPPLRAQLMYTVIRLDETSAGVPWESPFDGALQQVTDEAREELRLALRLARAKLKRVFKKHAVETQTVLPPVPLVRRRASRPMALTYARVRAAADGAPQGLAAQAAYQRSTGAAIDPAELEAEFNRDHSVQDLFKYFLFEAADLALRLDAYGHETGWVELAVPRAALTQSSVRQAWESFWECSALAPNRIRLALSAEELARQGKVLLANLDYLRGQGITLTLRSYDGTGLSLNELAALGVEQITLSPELAADPERVLDVAAEAMDARVRVAVPVDGALSETALTRMSREGVAMFADTRRGFMTEDELLQFILAEYPG